MSSTVLIADDHPIFRRGVRDVAEDHDDFEVIAEASDGAEAIRLISKLRPSIAVLDLSMPVADGLQVIAEARRHPDAPAFIILTLHDDVAYLKRALELGALGYLLKENAEEELITCLQAVQQGKRYISSAISWRLAELETNDSPSPLEKLSARERQVLDLIANHLTNHEIAGRLSVSTRTVENHRANICSKIGLQGPHALLKFAVEQMDGL